MDVNLQNSSAIPIVSVDPVRDGMCGRMGVDDVGGLLAWSRDLFLDRVAARRGDSKDEQGS